jgi:DNA-directed RNA polymerase specialized sigma24 family protein
VTDAEFQAVFDAHKDAVYRFVWRMARSPAAAEDMTQDVCIAVPRSPERFDPARPHSTRAPTVRPHVSGGE